MKTRRPSVDTLQKRLNLTGEDAIKLRKVLDGRLDPESFESVQKWVRQCYNRPSNRELKHEAANEIMGGHGIEAIRGGWQNGHWCDVQAVYVNMGDTYTTTLLYCRDRGWLVTSWGDYVETSERQGVHFS